MSPLAPYLLSISVKIFLATISTAILTLYTIPVIIRVAKAKKIYDMPNGRTSHKTPIPRLGGVAIFLSVLVVALIFIDITRFPQFQYIIAGSVIIFFIGLKDDILSISPWKKFIGQLIAASFLIFFADIRFTSIHGFFEHNAIPYWGSVFLTFFVVIVIVNAFNLIDGVDGLGAGLAMIAFITLGAWFFINGKVNYSIIAWSISGSLIIFLFYNLWGKTNKIFLGDTGAMFGGYFLAMFVILFNELNRVDSGLIWRIKATPVVSFAILMVPLFDTARVFLTRILEGKSPFYPDKNHIHHHLLELGFSHRKTTGILLFANIVYIWLAFLLQDINIYLLTGIIVLSGIMISYIPIYLNERTRNILPWTLLKSLKNKKAA